MDLSTFLPAKNSQTTLKERALAFLAMEVVDEMAESVIAIAQKIARKYPGSSEGKSSTILTLAHQIIGTLYPRSMSQGTMVSRSCVVSFSEETSRKTVGVYDIVSNGMSKPEIKRALETRNESYFAANFDEIFADVPFSLDGIKTLLLSPRVSPDDKDVIWDFLTDLLKICTQRDYCYSKIQWTT